ncbi:hypothetical protein ACFU53_46185 [Streptomyces sp. NPDC057474]
MTANSAFINVNADTGKDNRLTITASGANVVKLGDLPPSARGR